MFINVRASMPPDPSGSVARSQALDRLSQSPRRVIVEHEGKMLHILPDGADAEGQRQADAIRLEHAAGPDRQYWAIPYRCATGRDVGDARDRCAVSGHAQPARQINHGTRRLSAVY